MKFKVFMGVITIAVVVFFGVVIYKGNNYQVQEGDSILVDKVVTVDETGEEIEKQTGEEKLDVVKSEDNRFVFLEVLVGKTRGDEYEASYKLKADVTDSEGNVLYPTGTAVTEKGTILSIETAAHKADVQARADEQEALDTAKQEAEAAKEDTDTSADTTTA